MSDTPAQLGPYKPQQLLATGGQASVWLAIGRTPEGPRQVALKVPRTADGRSALVREAALLANTDHPNLVKLVEAAPDGSWLALERVPGVGIDQWAHGRPVGDILDAGGQLVAVVAYLHQLGIVHADLKPSNVLVTATGHLCLVDLGIAAYEGEAAAGFRGTLGYAAPELLSGKPPSAATDRYGVGALLYRCLTGRTPFVAPDPAALTYLPLVSLPSPPAAHRPEIAAVLNLALLGLLARDPARRPTDLERVAEVLRRSRDQPFGPPVLGMSQEREELRKAVVGAADGEPRIVVVYGVAGSGRRTLVAEAVDHARREGLPYLKGADPQAALAALRAGTHERPPVIVMKSSHAGARQLADTVVQEQLRCLLLLHADRPMPGLTPPKAVQITPSPLELHDAMRLVRMYDADPELADAWWKESLGLPVGILGRIRGWRRAHGLPDGPEVRLPAEAQRIFDRLTTPPARPITVASLAAELQVGEHQLLDQCEVLFAEGLIFATDEGRALAASSAPATKAPR